jgi:hypothetical protein
LLNKCCLGISRYYGWYWVLLQCFTFRKTLSENTVSFTSTYITSFPDESNKVCNYIHRMKAPESPAQLILDRILDIAFQIQLNGMLTSPSSSRHFPTKIMYACSVYPIQACSRASLSQLLWFPSFVLQFRRLKKKGKTSSGV